MLSPAQVLLRGLRASPRGVGGFFLGLAAHLADGRQVSSRGPVSRSRWRPRALVVVLAAAAFLVGAATAAQAHNILVRTSPADGSIAKVVPGQVTLTFNEPAVAVGTEIIVTGPSGQVQTGAAVLVDNTVTEHVRPASPAGPYTVIYRVTSSDGHPVSGRFTFSATSPSPGQRPTGPPGTTSPASTPASAPGQSPAWWWPVAGGAVVVLLVLVLIRIRKPRTTPYDEWDPRS
jgi:copper resistance protein C